MGFIDNLLGRKSTPAANPTQLLPLQTTMRTRGYLTGIGGQDLYAYLSRRLPGSLKDWTAVTGDLLLNSIVAISMDYYIRGFSQAVPMVFQLSDKDDEYEKLLDFGLILLLITSSMATVTLEKLDLLLEDLLSVFSICQLKVCSLLVMELLH